MNKVILIVLAVAASLLSASFVHMVMDKAIGTTPAAFMAGAVGGMIFSHYIRKIGNRTVA